MRSRARHRLRPARTRLIEHWGDPLYRQSYLLVLAGAINAITSFAFWIAATHYAAPVAIGRAASAVSAITIVSYATSGGLPFGILRFGIETTDLGKIVSTALAVTILSSVLAAIIFAVGAPLWTPSLADLFNDPDEVAVFATLCAGASAVVLLDNVMAVRRRSEVAAARSLAAGAGRLVALVVLAASTATLVYLAALVPIVASAVVAVLFLPKLEPGYRFRLGITPRVRSFFRYSFASYPSSLFGGAPPFALPLVALAVVGPRQTALFYIAWSITSVLLLLPSVVANITVSEGGRGYPWATAVRARRFSLSLVTPVIIGLGLAARPILAVFGHAYEAEAVWVLRISLLSLIPWVVMVTDLSALRVEHRYGLLLRGNVVFAILGLAGTAALGTWFGLEGLAAGWTIGVLAAAVAVHWLVRGPRNAERRALTEQLPQPVAA